MTTSRRGASLGALALGALSAALASCAQDDAPGVSELGPGDGGAAGCPDYSMPVSASFSLTPTRLEVRLALVAVPEELVFDRSPEKFVNLVEYQWDVRLDVFGDGRSTFAFVAENVVERDEVERRAPLPDAVQVRLVKYFAGGDWGHLLTTPDFLLEGNELVFRVDPRTDDELFSLTDGTRVIASTSIHNGFDYCDGHWP